MISIIIPVYNQELYISECLESILDQTYTDYEIIIVNDGSTDKSEYISRRYAKQYHNIRLINQENKGVSCARNVGIASASGEWLCFVDPDDYLDRNFLQTLIMYSNQCDIVSSCCYAFTGERKFVDHFYEKSFDCSTEQEKDILYAQLLIDTFGQPGITFTAIGVPWGKLYRTSFITKNHLTFDTKLRRQQDNAFNMYAFHYASRIRYIDTPLYYYRLDNIMNYYSSKYDSYSLLNACELQNRRFSFFQKKDNLNDVVGICLKNSTLNMVYSVFNKYIFNPENKSSYGAKRKDALYLFNHESFSFYLTKIHLGEINGLMHKLLWPLFKTKSIVLLYCVWNIKNYVTRIKSFFRENFHHATFFEI